MPPFTHSNTHIEPSAHVFRVPTVAALQARIRRAANRQPAQRTEQHRATTIAARRRHCDFGTAHAFGDEFDAALLIAVSRQIFQYFSALHV